jgi:hypothetical protein
MNRQRNERVIYGLFDDPRELEIAFNRLLAVDVPVDDISLLMNEDVHERDFKPLHRTHTREGVAVGSVVGSALGGVLGGLAVLGSAMTGIGVLVVGPMLALGASGGVLGGLIGHGIPEEEAKRLQDAIHAGKAMIAVHANTARSADIATAILKNSHGEPVELYA